MTADCYCRYLSDLELPPNVVATADPKLALSDATQEWAILTASKIPCTDSSSCPSLPPVNAHQILSTRFPHNSRATISERYVEEEEK